MHFRGSTPLCTRVTLLHDELQQFVPTFFAARIANAERLRVNIRHRTAEFF